MGNLINEINELYEIYEPLNGDLYIGLNDPTSIDYNEEERLIIGYEDLGGEYIYIDLENESNYVMMDSEYMPMKIFNNIKEFKSFVKIILELKEKNYVFNDEDEVNKYMIENIETYEGTDDNLLISTYNYLK